LSKRAVSFGDLPYGRDWPTQHILAAQNMPIKSVSLDFDASLMAATLERLEGKSDQFKITLVPRKSLKAGVFDQVVSLIPVLATGERLPPMHVHARGFVQQCVQIVPSDIILGVRTVGDTAEETLLLQSSTAAPFRIGAIQAGSDVSIEPLVSGYHHDIPIRIRHKIMSVGDQCQVLRVNVASSDGTKIELPLKVTYYGME
jgi:hypothetical protein